MALKNRVFKSLHEHPLFKMRQEIEQSAINTNTNSNGSPEPLSFKALILSKRQANIKEVQHHTKKVTFSPGVETIEVSHFFAQDPIESPPPFPMPKTSDLMHTSNELNSTESLNNSSSSSGVTSHSNNDETKNLSDDTLFKSFNDLLQRNEVHFKSLKVLKEEFMPALMKHKDSGEERLWILSDFIDQMYEFQLNTIMPELRSRQDSWSKCDSIDICQLFVQNIAEIKVYESFMSELDLSFGEFCRFLVDERNRNILNVIERKIEFRFKDLRRLVEQECPRMTGSCYVNLLLAHVMSWTHSISSFITAYQRVQAVHLSETGSFNAFVRYFNELAARSNHVLESMRNWDMLIRAQLKIGDKYMISDKRRVLLKEGLVSTWTPQLKVVVRIYIMLFNDLLIISDLIVPNDFNKLKPKRPLEVSGILVSENVNEFSPELDNTSRLDPNRGFTIHVPCIQKVFKLYASDTRERNRWVSAFRVAAESYATSDRVDMNRQVSIKTERLYCASCKTRFSEQNPRTCCKACGNGYCKLCLKFRASLDYDNGSMSQICTPCHTYFNSIQTDNGIKRPRSFHDEIRHAM